jgi:uncharacterized membrane protein/gas vesicle protein
MRQTTDSALAGLGLGKLVGGAAAGAILMYLLDPDRGRDRRTQGTDKIRGLGRQTTQALGSALHSAGNRLGSVVEDAGQRVSHVAESVAERTRELAEQVRPDHPARLGDSLARIGHTASDRLGESVNRMGESVSRVKRSAGRMLESPRGGGWSAALGGPTMTGSGLLGLYALMRRSPIRTAIGAAGLYLLVRSASNNMQLRSRFQRVTSAGRTYDIQKTIFIDVSPEEIYDQWCEYENFPRFMSHVIEVRDLGQRRSHWVVRGPAGTRLEWDAVLTEQSRPRRLAWRSEPGAEIPQSGSVTFESSGNGTQVTVRMSYTPPAGAIGHGLAMLLGADPERQMEADLQRMKSFIERGSVAPPEAGGPAGASDRSLH